MILTKKFIELIEKHADQLAERWLEEVRKNPHTPVYHTFTEKKLLKRAQYIFSHLGVWLESENAKSEIKDYFIRIGQERFQEGFSLGELVNALTLNKKVMWNFAQTEGWIDSAVDMHRLLELNNQLARLFDQAIFYAVVGYEAASKPQK